MEGQEDKDLAMFFEYGEKELNHLRKKDKALAKAIEAIGYIQRPVNTDVFASLVKHIIGQQISTAAQKTIWQRLCDKLGTVCAKEILDLDDENLKSCGLSFRKVDYIKNIAQKVHNSHINLENLHNLPDKEIIELLSSLNGIGVWTAEMLLIFSLQRPDIVSYGDLAIVRGMRMLYRKKVIDIESFQRYAKRYSPYGTVASLYLWAIAGGALPHLTDPAPKKLAKTKK